MDEVSGPGSCGADNPSLSGRYMRKYCSNNDNNLLRTPRIARHTRARARVPSTHTRARTHARRRTHARTHAHTHLRTIAHTYARARAHTHTRTRTHARMQARKPEQASKHAPTRKHAHTYSLRPAAVWYWCSIPLHTACAVTERRPSRYGLRVEPELLRRAARHAQSRPVFPDGVH